MPNRPGGLIGKGLLLAAVALVTAGYSDANFNAMISQAERKARLKAQNITCYNHLQIINLQQQIWANNNNKSLSSKATLDDLIPEMEQWKWDRITNCPGGGDYRLTMVREQPTCSVHGTFVPRKAGSKTAPSR